MEEKRRLPSWMLPAPTANKVSESKTPVPKAKGLLTRKQKKEVCTSSDEKSFLLKCETKRKKRGIVEEDASESHDFKQEVVVEKKRLRRVRRKVEEELDNSRTNEENKAPSSDEDDDEEDLTMDDLLSIAKQFVEDDKSDTAQQKSSERLQKRKSSLSSSMSKTSLITPQDTKSPIQEQTALHNESTENTISKVILEGITMTDDPAQDMLDLFLGPLLKKPIQKEEDTSYKDMIVTHEIKNQQHNAVVSNKPVNLTKKKSSLRDAVAMLLN